MDLGKRGDIGFPEAMVATAAVCVIAVAFLSFAASVFGDGEQEKHGIDWDWLGDVIISVDHFTVSPDAADVFMSETGATGIRITLNPMGVNDVETFHIDSGNLSGSVMVYRELFNIVSDDGRTIPTIIKAEVFS